MWTKHHDEPFRWDQLPTQVRTEAPVVPPSTCLLISNQGSVNVDTICMDLPTLFVKFCWMVNVSKLHDCMFDSRLFLCTQGLHWFYSEMDLGAPFLWCPSQIHSNSGCRDSALGWCKGTKQVKSLAFSDRGYQLQFLESCWANKLDDRNSKQGGFPPLRHGSGKSTI
jgi:hypothetical protein